MCAVVHSTYSDWVCAYGLPVCSGSMHWRNIKGKKNEMCVAFSGTQLLLCVLCIRCAIIQPFKCRTHTPEAIKQSCMPSNEREYGELVLFKAYTHRHTHNREKCYSGKVNECNIQTKNVSDKITTRIILNISIVCDRWRYLCLLQELSNFFIAC